MSKCFDSNGFNFGITFILFTQRTIKAFKIKFNPLEDFIHELLRLVLLSQTKEKKGNFLSIISFNFSSQTERVNPTVL